MANSVLDPHARELAKQLDGLPLALATAGAYLSQVTTSWEDYLCKYNTSWLKLQKTSPGIPSYEDRALYSTWNISYEHIRRQNESAAKLLQLWAYFDNEDLWYELLAGSDDRPMWSLRIVGLSKPKWFSRIVHDELSFNEVTRLLSNHALIEPRGVSGGYGMHSCVHAWTKYALNAETNTPMAILAVSCVTLAVPGRTVPEYWIPQRRLFPHANRCLELFVNGTIPASKGGEWICNVAGILGALYLDHGKIKESEVLRWRALPRFQRFLIPWGVNSLLNLGVSYENQGKMKPATVLYFKTLLASMLSSMLTGGNDQEVIFDIFVRLGIVSYYQGHHIRAEKWLLRAWSGYKKLGGLEHTSILHVFFTLGDLYSIQGKTEKAEEIYLQALTGYEKAWGPEHLWTLNTAIRLGSLYYQQGKLKEAERLYSQALSGYENAWGSNSNQIPTLDMVSVLGILHHEQGKLKEAEEMYLRLLAGYGEAFCSNAMCLSTMDNLGNMYSDQGKLAKAEEMYLRALAGFEKTCGSNAKCLAMMNTVNNLGIAYMRQGKLEKAEEMYLR